MPTSPEKYHVAVFAFPFGSHPLPLLQLVFKLAHAAPRVTFSFISTAQSNQTLFSKLNISGNIKAYNVSDGIPDNHVLGNPIERLSLFLQAGPENLQKGIDLAVTETNQRVTCIVADAFVTPSLTLAQNLQVPGVPVWLPLSCSLSVHFYTDLLRQQRDNCAGGGDKSRTLEFLPGMEEMRFEDLPDDVLNGGEEETLFSGTLASMGRVLPQAKTVVFNFYEELDSPLFVQDMKSKLQSMLYVGFLSLSLPLPPLPPSDTDATGCLSWLDKQSAKSVAYIGFGTVVTPPPLELVAVAEALEASGIPFLWSLKDNLRSLLPNGFLERTSMSGKIVPWAPQTQVLAHDSVGVFVTHGGCNSVFESMSNGVPMICRPFFGDHGLTGRMVEDIWRIGVNIEGRVFSKNGLLKSLNLILLQEEGKKMREKALNVKETVLVAAMSEGKAAKDFKTLVEVITSS